jgi:hypothetical protein
MKMLKKPTNRPFDNPKTFLLYRFGLFLIHKIKCPPTALLIVLLRPLDILSSFRFFPKDVYCTWIRERQRTVRTIQIRKIDLEDYVSGVAAAGAHVLLLLGHDDSCTSFKVRSNLVFIIFPLIPSSMFIIEKLLEQAMK